MNRRERVRARVSSARGARLLHTDRAAAEASYREAVACNPTLHEAWFDLGLIYKWSKRWEEAFDCNLRAAELVGEKRDEPAWWNLGIVATALRRWDVARRAWRIYGLDVEDGAGPLEGDFGYGPVRLNPEDDGEIVWGHRIDPARIRLASIPFPSSGHRWADVVLHDGAPNGYRELNGQRLPVFDELMRWEPSDVPTVEASVSADTVADVDRLLENIELAGHTAEDWTRNVRWLCKRCSEGIPHGEHSETALASGRQHLIGVAAPMADVVAVVRDWEQSPGRTCHRLDLAS